jgi:hypothetical protein
MRLRCNPLLACGVSIIIASIVARQNQVGIPIASAGTMKALACGRMDIGSIPGANGENWSGETKVQQRIEALAAAIESK